MTDDELRAEAKLRGYELIATDRLKPVFASVDVVVDADMPIKIVRDYLVDSLGFEIAAKLVEFNKIAWGPVDRWNRSRLARSQFYIVLPDAEMLTLGCSSPQLSRPSASGRK